MATTREPDAAATGLRDSLGRRVEYVRVSLTDRCNFRCVYCMPKEGRPFIPHERIITYEELLRLARVLVSLGGVRYKITGGEPLVRKGAVGFIAALARVPGVSEVTLTSNGSLVENELDALAAGGLRAINFSCDALDDKAFRRVTRTGQSVDGVLRAMAGAAARGLRVKMNMVPLEGYNEADIIPLARFALERGHHIRFIELMPVGSGRSLCAIPPKDVRAALERAFGFLRPAKGENGSGPARMYAAAGYPGRVGFISAMSDRFCASCNRVRLTSTGFLKTCLCHGHGVDLKTAMAQGADDAELRRLILEAVAAKPDGHTFSFAPRPEEPFFMHAVGG